MGQCFSSSRHHDRGDGDQTSRPSLSSTPLPVSSSHHQDSADGEQTSRLSLSSTPLPVSSLRHHDSGDEDQTSRPGSSSTPLIKQNYHTSHFSSSSCHQDSGDRDRTLRPGSSFTSLPKQNYEVFLSFRGEDTRHGFTDHLFHRLDDKGIVVFRDNEDLRVGEKIDQLLEAIKASKISVPIISPDYASSRWCLEELLQIIECNKTGQLVLPIFYKVKPSDVREQKGVFGENFRLYKEKNNLDEKLVQDLQNAFEVVTSMKGWESDKMADGYEGALVKIVVRRIFNELRKPILSVPDLLVGIEEHIEEIKAKFDAIPSNDAKIIVIHGMGGIGKTTLAKALYNEFSESFECQSFVPNIREASLQYKGMEGLQKQMISDILVDKSLSEISHLDEGITTIEKRFKEKRLLLLLDDVKDNDQLDKLAAKNNWFGPESIIIITTRNKNVVTAPVINLDYELNELNYDQSYKLFCKHAFGRSTSCPRDLEAIARDIVLMTGGLPLAIEVIGSLLHRKGERFWKDTKEKLRRMPDSTVRDKLKISYDALDHATQQIFLDIACLPVAYRLHCASYMWKSCGFYPGVGIEILVSLSLIKVLDEDHVVMHDQLKDLGRDIVCNEGCDEIGKRSRIWLQDEATEVIAGKQGTRKIQALILEGNRCKSQQFEGMVNLRFLCLDNVDLIGDFESPFLNLRWLYWAGANLENADIMRINFNPKKLVFLDLWHNNITENWTGWRQMKDLKFLRICDCNKVTTIPDLSALNELEYLRFEHCGSLTKIHPSIGQFSKTLKYLGVWGCHALEELPLEMWKMEELTLLDVSETGIKEIPIYEGYMQKLETLYAIGCEQLISISDSVGSLLKLQCLKISSCRSLMKIPESIGQLKLLTILDMRDTGVTQLPDSIGDLCNLEELHIRHTPIKCFPKSFGILSKLQELDLAGCRELESLSNLPCNLRSLKLNQLESLEIGHSDYKRNSAKEMDMAPENFTLLLELPSSLVDLMVYNCQTLRTLSNLSNLNNLLRLEVEECSELMEINILGGAESLTHLMIERCQNLSRLGDLSNLKMLAFLCLDGCEKLSDVEGMEKLTSLTSLSISGCNPNIKFPDLSTLRNLEYLKIMDAELMEIPWLQELKSLKSLTISSKSLQYLPDLSHLTELWKLDISDCEKLIEIRGIENMKSLQLLQIKGCTALRKLPDLPNVDIKSDGRRTYIASAMAKTIVR